MNKKQAAIEFRKAIQLFAATLTDEKQLMAIPTVFPAYKIGVAYISGDVFSWGVNSVGDPQLYQVQQNHTSAAEWPPDAAPSLYKAIGVTSDGTAVWVQPLGAHDAYNMGDVVSHNGAIWSSDVNGNVWEPGVYGWTEVTK
jgi:hypothetical protein